MISSDLVILTLAFFTAIGIGVFTGPLIIPMLTNLKIGQSIREEGPKSHLKKSGTPTMGGLIILVSFLTSLLIYGWTLKALDKNTIILLLSTLGFGLIGFLDDYIKVVKKRNLGLRAYQKIIGQLFFAILLAFYQYNNSTINTSLIIPFTQGLNLNLGLLYIPFIIFVTIGTVNSVNLTDGLDGLASSITTVVLLAFAYISFRYEIISISIFSIALAGGCIGFLFHNKYPAKVFMGDTGSMGLGGAVATIAVIMDMPLLLPILGGIYFAETLSVIIQVGSFKIRGKRVFLMSPLHHHYEEKGWKETKVVKTFFSLTLILSVIAVKSII